MNIGHLFAENRTLRQSEEVKSTNESFFTYWS